MVWPWVFAISQRCNGGMAWMLLIPSPVMALLPNSFCIVLPQNNLALKFLRHSCLYITSKCWRCAIVTVLLFNTPNWIIKLQSKRALCIAIAMPLPQRGVIKPALSPHIRIWFSTNDFGAKEKSLITSGLENKKSELEKILRRMGFWKRMFCSISEMDLYFACLLRW